MWNWWGGDDGGGGGGGERERTGNAFLIKDRKRTEYRLLMSARLTHIAIQELS